MSGVPSAQELDRLQYCTQSICRSSRMGESFDHDGRDERDALIGAASNAFVVVNFYPGAHMCSCKTFCSARLAVANPCGHIFTKPSRATKERIAARLCFLSDGH
jgi:hypothetical protein